MSLLGRALARRFEARLSRRCRVRAGRSGCGTLPGSGSGADAIEGLSHPPLSAHQHFPAEEFRSVASSRRSFGL